MGSWGFVIMLLTSHKIPTSNCDNVTLISSRSIFPPLPAGGAVGLYLQHQRRGLPADGEGPLQLQTYRGATGSSGSGSGCENEDDLVGAGSNMLFNFTKRDDWLR